MSKGISAEQRCAATTEMDGCLFKNDEVTVSEGDKLWGVLNRSDLAIDETITFQNCAFNEKNVSASKAIQNAIADANTEHNPIFISGPTGIGKTQLLNAAGNLFKERDSDSRIILVKCATFYKDVTEDNSDIFSKGFKDCDLLLLDDFDENCVGCSEFNEAFFCILCTRLENNRQTIIASPYPFQEYNLPLRLEARLKKGLSLELFCS